MAVDEVTTDRMHFIERGNRTSKPILFVHGWPTNATIWKYQLDDGLSDEFHLLAVDLPGFGDSEPQGEASMKAFATAVRDFIRAEKLPPVFLVGWSMGAGVVMSYNEHFGSDGLSGIGIVDDCPKLYPADGWLADIDTTFSREAVERWRNAWAAGDRRSVIAELTEMEYKYPDRHAENIEWAIQESLRSDPGFAMAALLEVMELDFRESLRQVSVPTLLLYGEYSNMTTAANRRFMQKTIPNASLVVFSESGHNPMIEEPEKFNEAIRSFVRNL